MRRINIEFEFALLKYSCVKTVQVRISCFAKATQRVPTPTLAIVNTSYVFMATHNFPCQLEQVVVYFPDTLSLRPIVCRNLVLCQRLGSFHRTLTALRAKLTSLLQLRKGQCAVHKPPPATLLKVCKIYVLSPVSILRTFLHP